MFVSCFDENLFIKLIQENILTEYLIIKSTNLHHLGKNDRFFITVKFIKSLNSEFKLILTVKNLKNFQILLNFNWKTQNFQKRHFLVIDHVFHEIINFFHF